VLAQSPEESQTPDKEGPTPDQVCALDNNGDLIVQQIKDIISTLILPLFIELATITDQDQRAQQA
jgi:hypothetical protein